MLPLLHIAATEFLPFRQLVLIDDPEPRHAALNMAIDDVLLMGLEDIPLLRCYRWADRAVSFGCFGKLSDVRREYPGRDWVRRWTGGGSVEHGHDFTFSLLVPRAFPLTALPATESYRLIHSAVATALDAAGSSLETTGELKVEMAPGPATQHTATSKPFLRPCFDNPVEYDLMSAGRKVAGGAQRRSRRGLLHQGSIQNMDQPNSDHVWRTKLARSLAASLSSAQEARTLTAGELMTAHRKATEKYSAPSWLEKH